MRTSSAPTTEAPAEAPPARPRGGSRFRRATPFLLFRHPALLAAIALGAFLLAVAAAAYPLFMAATTSDLVRGAVERPSITRYGAGLTFTFHDLPIEPVEFFGRGAGESSLFSPDPTEFAEPFTELAEAGPVLGRPVESFLGGPITVSVGDRVADQEGRLFSSTGVLDEIEVVAGEEGDGVWIPDLIADQLGVGPGDRVEVANDGGGRATPVVVDGIYRAVYATPPGGYWLPWANEFRAKRCFDCPLPPQPVLVDRDQFLTLTRDLRQNSAIVRLYAPLSTPDISLEEARALRQYEDKVIERMRYPDGDLGRPFACCRRFFYQSPDLPFAVALTTFGSSIGYVVDEAEKRIVAVEGPARVLAMAGIGVALVVVAAAGAFSVRARRVEAAWLFAHGRSATYVGGKTAAETAIPCVAGGALGFGFAVGAVSLLGSGGTVEGSIYLDAVLASTVAVIGAIALTAVVGARTYLRVVDPHGRRFAHLVGLVPWELGLIALAWVSLDRLREGGAFITDERLDVVRPSLALVAFPFLLFAGVAILVARLARLGYGWLRRPTASAPPAPYMATRRLAGGGALTMLLVGGAGLCLGTFFHAQIVAQSLQTSVEAKAQVFAGSDVAATVVSTASVPDDFPFPATRVLQVGEGARTASGRPLDLLAIDPETFADAAYWNDAFADRSLEDLTADLVAVGDGDLPIVLAAGGDLSLDEILIGGATVPVDVIATAVAFPGLYSMRPLVIADEQALVGRLDLPYNPLARFGAELWVRGEPAAVSAALARMEHRPFGEIDAELVEDIPHVAAAIDTFLVVNVLGTVAALLTCVGMLMYLQARQRSQVVSYALSVRMGMRDGQNRRALTLELGVMLGLAFAIGAALAIAAASLTVPRLDPITAIPPSPFLVIPVPLMVGAAVVLAAAVWVGAAITNRRARTFDLGEVMRVAE
jgi:putative ABC transport system permease protein